MPIIFITGYGDVPMTVHAMKAGALEFLTKPFTDDVLLDAIRQAIARSRDALRHEAEMPDFAPATRHSPHATREVMALVVSGLLNKQVGGELGITEITVKAHRGQLMRKMQAEFSALVSSPWPRDWACAQRKTPELNDVMMPAASVLTINGGSPRASGSRSTKLATRRAGSSNGTIDRITDHRAAVGKLVARLEGEPGSGPR